MAFSEISIYQVKPDKTDEFETIMKTIKEGLPPDKIARVVKGVRYAHYWEFDTKENYGKAQKVLYDSHWKAIEKCLIAPHDKILGEVIV